MAVIESPSQLRARLAPQYEMGGSKAVKAKLTMDEQRQKFVDAGYNVTDLTPEDKDSSLFPGVTETWRPKSEPKWFVYKLDTDGNIAVDDTGNELQSIVYPKMDIDSDDPSRPVYQGFWKERQKDAIRAVEGVGASLGSAADIIKGLLQEQPAGMAMQYGPAVQAGQMSDEEIETFTTPLRKWGDVLAEDARSWQMAPGRDGEWYDKASDMFAQTSAYMMAVSAATAIGVPFGASGPLAFVSSSLMMGDNIRRNAIDHGASQERADLEAWIGGPAVGALEFFQLSKFIKFAKGYDKLGKAYMAKAITEKSLTKMAKNPKHVTSILKLAGSEALVEVMQEATEMGIAKMGHSEKITFYDAIERMTYAATGAAIMTPFFAFPGVIFNRRLETSNRNEPIDLRFDSINEAMTAIRTEASNALVHDMGKIKATLPSSKKLKSKKAFDKFAEEQQFFPEKKAVDPLSKEEVTAYQEKTGAELSAVLKATPEDVRAELEGKTAEEKTAEPIGPVEKPATFEEKWAAVDKKFHSLTGLAALAKHVAPKWMVNKLEGIEYLTRDLESARISADLMTKALQPFADKAIKFYRSKASRGDKFYSWLTNRAVKPIQQLYDDLDSREWADESWSQEDQETFNDMRTLLQGLREVANIGRKKAGLPEIKNITNYISHWSDTAVDAVSSYSEVEDVIDNNGDVVKTKKVSKKELERRRKEKSHPLQFGYIWRLAKRYADKPKDFKNSSAFRRKLKDEIETHYSKNVDEIMKALISYDVRDALLTNPYTAAKEELTRLEKDGGIPKDVRNDLAKYMTYDIARQVSEIDEEIDKIFVTPLKIANYALKPFNREILSVVKPTSRMFRQLAHVSALGFRLKPAIRNLGQRILLTDLYHYRDLWTAQCHQADGFWPSVDVGTDEEVTLGDWLKGKNWYQATENYLSENDEALTNRVGRASSKLFHMAHISNVNVSARVGYTDWLRRYEGSKDKNSSYYKHVEKKVVSDLRKEAQKEGKDVKDFITKNYDKEMERGLVKKEDMEDMIHDAVRLTQWEYLPTSMPLHYRSDAAKAAMLFQSWVQNYYGGHVVEMAYRMKHGRDTSGRVLEPRGRAQALKGLGGILAAGKAMEAMLGISILKFVLFPHDDETPPESIPAFQVVDGVYKAAFSDDEYERKKSISNASSVLELLIPGKQAYNDVRKLYEQQDLKSFLFYDLPKE